MERDSPLMMGHASDRLSSEVSLRGGQLGPLRRALSNGRASTELGVDDTPRVIVAGLGREYSRGAKTRSGLVGSSGLPVLKTQAGLTRASQLCRLLARGKCSRAKPINLPVVLRLFESCAQSTHLHRARYSQNLTITLRCSVSGRLQLNQLNMTPIGAHTS